MEIYPIPEYLQDSHDGDEWAVAAILEGRVVALLYVRDIAPQLLDYVDTPSEEFIFRRWASIQTTDLDQLLALGRAIVGMVGANGFQARWHLRKYIPSNDGIST